MSMAPVVQAAQVPMNLPRMGVPPAVGFIKTLESSLVERYRPRNQDFETDRKSVV